MIRGKGVGEDTLMRESGKHTFCAALVGTKRERKTYRKNGTKARKRLKYEIEKGSAALVLLRKLGKASPGKGHSKSCNLQMSDCFLFFVFVLQTLVA